MQTEGSDACQRALDTVIKLPEAKQLFDESLSRFRDVTCIGLCNWANVHLCHAKKLLEHAAEGGKRPADIKKEFEEHCKEALKRYNEALGYNGALVVGLACVLTFSRRRCAVTRAYHGPERPGFPPPPFHPAPFLSCHPQLQRRAGCGCSSSAQRAR